MIGRLLNKARVAYHALSVRSFQDFERSSSGYITLQAACRECRAELHHAHQHYVTQVSSHEMAVSVELSALLLALCRINRWTRLLDMGSGFSSYVFRRYAKENPGVTVYSVDDDAKWLHRTKMYLNDQRLRLDNLMTLEEFRQHTTSGFNCVLHDLNLVDVRIQYVGEVLSRVAPGGLIVFDDVHKTEYVLPLMGKLSSQPGVTYSLKAATIDQFGRYAFGFIGGFE